MRIKNATLPGAYKVDITIENGRIAAIAPTTDEPADIDAAGGLVLPACVDIHTHLDKGHIWPRRPNPDGTFPAALAAVAADRAAHWTAADVARRMDFSLRCAYAHGTAAIRTHLDSAPPQHAISWPVFAEMRARWAGRIELQATALLGPDHLLDPALLEEVARTVATYGGQLGGAISVFDRAPAAIAAVIDAAGRHGLALDLHIDESLDPAARSLRALADRVLATGYEGRVLAGHCCALAVHDDAAETIARVAQAGIAIVSLPMCNLYLQDRHLARTPLMRGVTLLQELQAAGIQVCLASDNTRDPFYAYGDLDPLEVLREAARIAHLDHPDPWAWLAALTTTPASFARFAHKAELVPGAPADLILCRARTWTELLARPQSDRVVIRCGQKIDTTLPDYRELD